MKPANHHGLITRKDLSITGRGIGLVSGKACFNLSVNPLFIEAFKFTIFCIPSNVRCSFWLINSTILQNIIKSARLCVIKGYFKKKGITLFTKSPTDPTTKSATSELFLIVIVPTPPKQDCIEYNKPTSFLCRVIFNLAKTDQPIFILYFLSTLPAKDAAASQHPAT